MLYKGINVHEIFSGLDFSIIHALIQFTMKTLKRLMTELNSGSLEYLVTSSCFTNREKAYKTIAYLDDLLLWMV